MIIVLLIFWGTIILLPVLAAPFYVPTNNIQVFFFGGGLLKNNSHPNRHEVIPSYDFDLHFLDDIWCWASFYMPVGHLYVFLGEMYIQFLFLFKIELLGFLPLNCKRSFYILVINPLSGEVCKFFSYSVVCLSLYWLFSFPCRSFKF